MMKLFVNMCIVILLLVSVSYAAPPSPFVPCSDGDGLCLDQGGNGVVDFRIGSTGAISMGQPSEVGIEVILQSHSSLNAVGEVVVDYMKTMELTDDTDGAEISVMREYVRGEDHLLAMVSSTKTYSAEPTGSEYPAIGCIVKADRATWDPLSKGSGGGYLVRWTGSAWVAIDAQDS